MAELLKQDDGTLQEVFGEKYAQIMTAIKGLSGVAPNANAGPSAGEVRNAEEIEEGELPPTKKRKVDL